MSEPMSDTRQDLADILSGFPIGSGYYSTTVGTDEAREMADAILAEFPWIAEWHQIQEAFPSRHVMPATSERSSPM